RVQDLRRGFCPRGQRHLRWGDGDTDGDRDRPHARARADRAAPRRAAGAHPGIAGALRASPRRDAPGRAELVPGRRAPADLPRAATGRDMILRIEGSYHGHHDSVMVSVRPPLQELGEHGAAGTVPFGAGHPRPTTALTLAIPFNDLGALERALADRQGAVAAL